MKLLALDQFSELGGAQQCLLDLLPAITERGWRVRVAMQGGGPMFERVSALGFETVHLGWSPRQIRELASDIDLVYINGPRLLPVAALAGLRRPVVFHSHSYLTGLKRQIAGVALRQLRAPVIANCEFVAGVWRRYASEIVVVYNGVAGPPEPLPARGQRPISVGCIGRIAPEKGQLDFIEAARIIHGAHPDWRFIIFGSALFSGDSYERKVRLAASEVPVKLAGWVDNVYNALAQLDVVLVPSAGHEATTRVVLEAQAAGVPVVAFSSGGIPEIIQHGITGWLARSVGEMAKFAIQSVESPVRPGGEGGLARYRAQVLNKLQAVWLASRGLP